MKIEIIKHQELIDIGRTVKPGDVLESSDSVPAELLAAYVQNGIAKEIKPPDSNSKSKIQNSKSSSGGE